MRACAADPEGRASACPPSGLQRRHPIHLSPVELHSRSIIVFVTVCTSRRRRILASPAVHQMIVSAWREAETWLVGRYVIMPDHVHLFCAPNGLDSPSLERWTRYWKSLVTKILNAKNGSIWQRHHWDRQLRSGESYSEKWNYVRNNPVRHGCVTEAEHWPYQGELNILQW